MKLGNSQIFPSKIIYKKKSLPMMQSKFLVYYEMNCVVGI